jgi:hypothetical protein
MAESFTVFWFGIVVLALAAVLVIAHYRRERRRTSYFRWLDTHPTRDWLHHRY